MPTRISLTYDRTLPIDVRGLVPESFSGKPVEDIQRYKVWLGNQQVEFGELFEVSGDTQDETFIVEGDINHVHWLGSNMSRGSIIVHGNAGRHLGSGMSGGEIEVKGDVSLRAGNETRGGLIRIHGNVGDHAGSFYPGSRVGMNGGTLLIHGNAGTELGSLMRRGMIAVSGNADVALGHNMRAGTILVFGKCGDFPGVGMRRGTIGLLGGKPKRFAPTFVRGGYLESVAIRLVAKHLLNLQFDSAVAMHDQALSIYHGDLLEGGRGEMWIAN